LGTLLSTFGGTAKRAKEIDEMTKLQSITAKSVRSQGCFIKAAKFSSSREIRPARNSAASIGEEKIRSQEEDEELKIAQTAVLLCRGCYLR